MRRLKELYKNISRRVLLIPAVTCIVFVSIRVYLGIAAAVSAGSVFLLLLFLVCERHGKQLLSFILTASVCLYLGGWFICYRAKPSGGDTKVECKVHSVTHDLSGQYKLRVFCSEYGFLEFKVEGEDIPVAGDEIVVEGRAYEPDSPRDPGQFEYKAYLARRGIYKAFSPEDIKIKTKAGSIFQFASKINDKLYDLRCFVLALYEDNAPLAASIFLGDNSLTEDSSRNLYKRNGCAHLLAVSGTHFAGFLAVVTYFLGKGKRTKPKTAVYVLLCVFLGAFTGWSNSVTRSCIMCSASYCSKDTLSGLSTACIVMILADPYNALSYGFLMTCSASVAITCLTPLIRSRLDKHVGKDISGVISPVIASQAGMLPFMSVTSQKYGVIPLLVQVITSFIASLACSFFVPSVVLSMLVSKVFIGPSVMLLEILDNLVLLVDRYYVGISVSSQTAMAAVIVIFILLYKDSRISRILIKPACLILCVSIGVSISELLLAPDTRIVFIDVGQGDSCLVMDSGKTVLIDGGTYDAGRDDVLPVLEYYDIRHVDIAVATHWDRDHIAGLLYLYDLGYIDHIYTSYVGNGLKQQEIMEEFLPGRDIESIFLSISKGDSICLSKECIIDVIYPESEDVSNGENEDSLVMKITSSETILLLTGDLGIEGETELLSEESIGNIDILKAGHHGSEFSTGYLLLEDTFPDIAIISAGINNPYGHPSPVTVKRLNEYDAEVLSTQDLGAVTVDIRHNEYKIYGYLNPHE